MHAQVTLYNILIASPGDTQTARGAVREAVQLWNATHTKSRRVVLVPLGWETDASPEMGKPAQTSIHEQLSDEADITVAIFHTRLGTPTAAALSGTVDEINRALAGDRPVLVFFSTSPVNPREIDVEEHARLRAYESECQKNGLLATFNSTDDLKSQLQRDLTFHVDRLQNRLTSQSASSPPPPQMLPTETADLARSVDDSGKEPPGGVEVTQVASPAEAESYWELLTRGEYEKGMAAAQASADEDKSPVEKEDWIALCRFHAFRSGRVARALDDLAKDVAGKPESYAARIWYARALDHDGRTDQAISELKEVVAAGAPEATLSWALATLIRILAEGDAEGAKRLAREGLARLKDVVARSSVLTAFAGLFVDKANEPTLSGFALQELGVSLRPNDSTARFDLAYAYTKANADKMAIAHYVGLLKRDKLQASAANNAGVAAARLAMPLTANAFYRQGEKHGESLAIANLVWAMIEGGFADEAQALIKSARGNERVHPNLEKAAGTLTSRLESEKEKVEEIVKECGEVRKARARYGTALTHSIALESLTGTYDGDPSSLLLTVNPDSSLSGTFFSAIGRQAVLTGRLEGAVLSFVWQDVVETQPQPARLSILSGSTTPTIAKRGQGYLFFDEEHPSGQWTVGEFGLEPPEGAGIVVWRLRRLAQ